MVNAQLVAADFAAGTDLVKALDKSPLSIRIALWLYSFEYEDWRFVLASPVLDAAQPAEAYGLIHNALASAGISLRQTPTLMILEMSDPFIRALRRYFSKTKSVEGMRLGNQRIGDRFIVDALVYRIR